MPKEDTLERSGGQDLSKEELEKMSQPIEGERKSEEGFHEVEDDLAPIFPQDPRKVESWDKLHPDRQVELFNKYQAQKKTWDEWEKNNKKDAA